MSDVPDRAATPPEAAPDFSVVVATRNRAATLARTLEAIAAQRAASFEVLVVDDGSQDAEAARIAEQVAALGPRFRQIATGPAGHGGSGPARARNAGLAAARGRWLAFCDDDDAWCDPDHLRIAASALHATGADAYVASQRGIAGDQVVIDDWQPELTAAAPGWPAVGDDGVRDAPIDALLAVPRFAHLNVLIVRRVLALEVGGFWAGATYEEDLDFYWRVLDRASRVLFRPAFVAVHHVPDAEAAASASTRLDAQDRLLQRLAVRWHVIATATRPALVARAVADEGDLLRTLSLEMARTGRVRGAAALARQALAQRFTPRWAAYSAWLTVRAWAQPSARGDAPGRRPRH